MKVEICEPLRAYLADSTVQSAVNLLLKNGSDKRVGIEDSAPYADQADYRAAWLASREIFVAWHAILDNIWKEAWLENENWAGAQLTELSTLETKAADYDLPTLHVAWHEEWFGRVYRTAKGKTVGLYVYADTDRVYLNFDAPELRGVPDGWEIDDDDRESIEIAEWTDTDIDLSQLEPAASNLLAWLATR